MKTTPKIKSLLIAGALLGLTSACQKESLMDTGSLNPASADMKKAVEAQGFAKEVTFPLNGVLAGLRSGETASAQASRVGGCGSIIYDTLSSPKKIIVDYGKTNCNNGGHLRRGKLILTYTGDLYNEGSEYVYSTEDFYVDNNRYEGTRVMTNTGTRVSDFGSNIHYRVVDDFTVTYAFTGSSVRNQGESDHEWVSGVETEFSFDDIFFINGYMVMTGGGLNMHSESRETLRQDVNFPFIISGSMKYQNKVNAENSFLIDYTYPNGDRDNQALITYSDGSTEVVTLR